MGKKFLLLMFGAVGLSISIHGCQSVAVQMSDGEMLYRAKCSSCHNIIEPNRYNNETWQKYVDEYGKKMTIEEKQLVLQYLAGSD
jgi:cytochrome c5